MVWIPCLKHGMTNRNSVVWQSVVISLPNIQGVITANVQFGRVRSAHPTLFIFLPAWERGHRPENQGNLISSPQYHRDLYGDLSGF